jgi:hypothetical protein
VPCNHPRIRLTEPLDVIDFHNICARALIVTDSAEFSKGDRAGETLWCSGMLRSAPRESWRRIDFGGHGPREVYGSSRIVSRHATFVR